MTAPAPRSDHPDPGCPARSRPSLRVHAGGRTDRGRQPPALPEPGTRVVLIGTTRRGVVKPYEAQWSRGAFPVRFDDCQWRLMRADDLYLEEVDSR